jgi:hypothetical protein
MIVKKRQRRLTGVYEMVLSLSGRGLTHGDISAHLAEVYGASPVEYGPSPGCRGSRRLPGARRRPTRCACGRRSNVNLYGSTARGLAGWGPRYGVSARP